MLQSSIKMVSLELWSFLAIISLFVFVDAYIESWMCNHVFIFGNMTFQADCGVSCQVSKLFFCERYQKKWMNDYQDYLVPKGSLGLIQSHYWLLSAGQYFIRAVINHMTCYNLNWPKIKLSFCIILSFLVLSIISWNARSVYYNILQD